MRQISEAWKPVVIGELNGHQVKLAKLEGEFIWHHHEREDELFYVLSGILDIEFRDSAVRLEPGEMVIVPKGVEHRPRAQGVAHVMFFEPASTLNTGNIRNDRTVEDLETL